MPSSASGSLSLDNKRPESSGAGKASADIPLLIERLESLLYRYHMATKRSAGTAAGDAPKAGDQ